ncbi:hypothetical protein WJX72_003560 [[Myrmecia] bisecta]|uniref:Uncharacterized protein n=1 Tax=[Myrmecia] bisecta TaxID=41462 RepID=A0AAW1QEN7_9CHLO
MQQTNDQITNEAARKKKAKGPTVKGSQTSAPVLVLAAAVLAGLLWWRRRHPPARKPSVAKAGRNTPSLKAGKAEALPSSRPNSSLPRNKASKSARSRQRKQEERKKKAVEEDAKKAAKNAGPAYDSDDEENNKLILTSKFYDSARRDTLTGPVSRIPSLGGAASQQR